MYVHTVCNYLNGLRWYGFGRPPHTYYVYNAHTHTHACTHTRTHAHTQACTCAIHFVKWLNFVCAAAGGGEDRDDSWLPPDVEPFVLRGGITAAIQVRSGPQYRGRVAYTTTTIK